MKIELQKDYKTTTSLITGLMVKLLHFFKSISPPLKKNKPLHLLQPKDADASF